jgi:hypothetical protein
LILKNIICRNLQRRMTMTRKNCFIRLLVSCTVVLFLAACGGGGDGDGGNGGGTTIIKEATLTIGQEVPAAIVPTPPATNPITGTMTVTLAANNAVSGILTLGGDFARVTAAHIHDGKVGIAGPVVIGLVDGGNGSWSVPAAASFTAAQAALFTAGDYHVNVPTALNAPGEIRGQLIGFADNIQPIFTTSCATSTCHVAGSSTGAPMSLVAGVSWGNLVGQLASSGGIRVIAGDAANSVLVARISGTTLGTRMPPLPATLLPANEQNLIKVWIDMGAKDN